MKKIKVFETFAGLGAQHKALTLLKKNGIVNFEIVATSEWDSHVNIAYDAIHNTKDFKENSLVEIENCLSEFTNSLDSKKPVSLSSIMRRGSRFYNNLYNSIQDNNNLGSIVEINGEDLVNKTGGIDLLTYSFPCQDLSTAGSWHGGNKGMAKGTNTRSGLLWQVERILTELDKINEKPRYLLLENVKNMLSSMHIKDYLEWLNRLNELGYNTQTFILNAKDYGIPQGRERVYALSVLNNVNFKDTFKNSDETKPLRKRVIEDNKKIVDISSKLGIQKRMDEIIKDDYNNSTYLEEAIGAMANDTPSRQTMKEQNPYLVINNTKRFEALNRGRHYTQKGSKYFIEQSRTVTTKQDRNPNSGVVDAVDTVLIKEAKLRNLNKTDYRFITPREAFLLMGFEEKDFENIIKKYPNISKEILYRQAGNSIVVNVLVSIFNYLSKF